MKTICDRRGETNHNGTTRHDDTADLRRRTRVKKEEDETFLRGKEEKPNHGETTKQEDAENLRGRTREVNGEHEDFLRGEGKN